MNASMIFLVTDFVLKYHIVNETIFEVIVSVCLTHHFLAGLVHTATPPHL